MQEQPRKLGAAERASPNQPIKNITPLIDKLLDALVLDGLTTAQAAKRIGQQHRYVSRCLASPAVAKEMNKRIDELRTAERAGNIHAALRVRDIVYTRGEFSAAEATAALKAAQWLHGEPAGGPNGGVNVNINLNPGYVIDLTDGQPLTKQQVIEHNALESLDDDTDAQE